MGRALRGVLSAAIAAVVLLACADGAGASTLPCVPLLILKCPPTHLPPKVPPPPPPALAVAGAQYDGHDGTLTYAELDVASTGTRLARFSFGFRRGRCSDGGRYDNGGGAGEIASGATIDASGHASYSRLFRRAFSFTRTGRRVTGRETISFVVTFAGDRATGTLHDAFSARRLKCSSGPVGFVVYRDGTAGAPLRTPAIDTGSYRGAARGGSTPFSALVFLPWQVVSTFKLSWRGSCRTGAAVRGTPTFSMLPLRGERFGSSGSATQRFAHGLYGRSHYRLSGSFYHLAGDSFYRVRASWRYSVRIYRAGSLVDTCSSSPPALAGVGPAY